MWRQIRLQKLFRTRHFNAIAAKMNTSSKANFWRVSLHWLDTAWAHTAMRREMLRSVNLHVTPARWPSCNANPFRRKRRTRQASWTTPVKTQSSREAPESRQRRPPEGNRNEYTLPQSSLSTAPLPLMALQRPKATASDSSPSSSRHQPIMLLNVACILNNASEITIQLSTRPAQYPSHKYILGWPADFPVSFIKSALHILAKDSKINKEDESTSLVTINAAVASAAARLLSEKLPSQKPPARSEKYIWRANGQGPSKI